MAGNLSNVTRLNPDILKAGLTGRSPIDWEWILILRTSLIRKRLTASPSVIRTRAFGSSGSSMGSLAAKSGLKWAGSWGAPTVTNFWIPDGYKDIPVDRRSPRERLEQSLDKIFAEKFDAKIHLDAVESKLFGIGAESYTVGSHEFYLGYAISRQKLLCLDSGHFHPTETIADKISSVLMFCPQLLLHVSRPVRWDSDHVVLLDDELQTIAKELIRGGYIERTHIGLDFFDASINRVAAWLIGTRNMLKALLVALLEPFNALRELETKMDYTQRLAVLEESKALPWAAVWDCYCAQKNVPVGMNWIREIKQYEQAVLSKRSS